MSNLKKKIKEAFDRDKITYLFDGLEDSTATPLSELEEGYSWEYDSLEEELEDSTYEYLNETSSDQDKVYKVGDIIMTNNYVSSSGGSKSNNPHRVLLSIVDTTQAKDGTILYKGFLLSSKVAEKSNKKGSHPYPNNIYINNYSTILYKGASSDKEAFIRVDDLVSFTNEDLSERGSWKGSASREFIEFVKKCYDNYKSGKDNSEIYWER